MKPVLESLVEIHEAGLIHRDISPDNVMVDKKGRIKLIDFGSVRNQSTVDEKTYTVTLKHGFAPPEQYYAKGKQGPWTDVYSICATMYRMLTGKNPPNSIERMAKDEYVSPAYCGVNISPKLDYVLRKGLCLNYEERYHNIKQLIDDMYSFKSVGGGMAINMAPNTVPQPMVQNLVNRPVSSQQTPVQQIPYQSNVRYTQQQPSSKRKKSKSCLTVIVTILIVAFLVLIVIPFIVGFITGISGDDNNSSKKATEGITVEDAKRQITDKSESYSNHGVTITFPEGYEYDEMESSEDLYYYFCDYEGSFMVFSGYTEGVSEEQYVNNMKTYIKESISDNEWINYKTDYNGISCTEFSGQIEESGVCYDAVVSFVYFSDVYLVVIYMPMDGDMADYITAMETIEY